MKLSDLKAYTDVFVPCLTSIAVVVAAFWTLYLCSQQRYENRVRETLEYIKQYDDPELLKARSSVYTMWEKEDNEYKHLLMNASTTESEIASFVVQVVLKNQTAASILNILDFFERVSICTMAGLCDRATAVLYMRRHLQEFWRQNYYYIDHVRKEYRNGGIGRATEELYSASLEQ